MHDRPPEHFIRQVSWLSVHTEIVRTWGNRRMAYTFNPHKSSGTLTYATDLRSRDALWQRMLDALLNHTWEPGTLERSIILQLFKVTFFPHN
jgi:hypothetical protein